MVLRQDYAGPERFNIARPVAAIVGVAYILVGIVGFVVTGFGDDVALNTNADLIGFDLNTFHNVVHLVIGLGLLIGSRARDVVVTQGLLIGGGLVYILAALLGFLNDLQILSINDGLAADNFLHLGSGLAALLVGMIGAWQTGNARRRGGGYEGSARGGQPRTRWDQPREA
jgi:hypothetical protein